MPLTGFTVVRFIHLNTKKVSENKAQYQISDIYLQTLPRLILKPEAVAFLKINYCCIVKKKKKSLPACQSLHNTTRSGVVL